MQMDSSSTQKPIGKNALRLRPLNPGDDKALRAYFQTYEAAGDQALAPLYERTADAYLFKLANELSCSELVDKLRAASEGKGLPNGWVPCTRLFAEVGSQFVGDVSIRHALTPELREYGNMIGYCVAPPFRRRGYATAMLAAALPLVRPYWRRTGTKSLIIDCHATNVGSRRVIEKNGGVLVRRGKARGVSMLYFSMPQPDAADSGD